MFVHEILKEFKTIRTCYISMEPILGVPHFVKVGKAETKDLLNKFTKSLDNYFMPLNAFIDDNYDLFIS